MEDQENDLVIDPACGSLSESSGVQFEPLFIAEDDDDDHFEDCVEEMVTALRPGESIAYSQRCRKTLQAEFDGLVEQMLAQLENFEADHESLSTDSLCSPGAAAGAGPEFAGGPMDTGEPDECGGTGLHRASEQGTAAAGGVEAELVVTMTIEEVGALFEGCIEEAGRLERRRDQLVEELLELERPLAEEVQALRGELGEARRLLAKAWLEREGLQEEVRLARRRLFVAARDCAQSQVELATWRTEVEQLSGTQEELQALEERLTEEASQVRSDHQGRLEELHARQRDSVSQATAAGLALGGQRASCDLQQYLQEGRRALEEWYEPRLVGLLKRREASAEALRKAREQSQELRLRLGPLREEEQRLGLQRACLEERMRLMEQQRKENVEQYRETVDMLEENSRELKTELQIQRNKTKELETVKNSLAKELHLYRDRIEDHGKHEPSLVEQKT